MRNGTWRTGLDRPEGGAACSASSIGVRSLHDAESARRAVPGVVERVGNVSVDVLLGLRAVLH